MRGFVVLMLPIVIEFAQSSTSRIGSKNEKTKTEEERNSLRKS